MLLFVGLWRKPLLLWMFFLLHNNDEEFKEVLDTVVKALDTVMPALDAAIVDEVIDTAEARSTVDEAQEKMLDLSESQ